MFSAISEANRYRLHLHLVISAAFLLATSLHTSNAHGQLQFAYPGAEDGRWSQLAAELAERLTGQEVSVEAYPAYELGGNEQALSMVQDGRVDMAAIVGHALSLEVPEFKLLSLPFLSSSIEEARAIVTDEYVRSTLSAAAEDRGFQILGYTWMIGAFVSTIGCVVSPENIEGSKIMDGPPEYQQLFWEAGASPIPLSVSEFYQALAAGLADTGVFHVEVILSASMYTVTECLTNPTDIAAFVLPVVIIVGSDAWLNLSGEMRSAVRNSVSVLEDSADEAMSGLVDEIVEQYLEAGNDVRPMDDANLAEWRELAEPQYESFVEELGETGDALLGAATEAR